MMDKKVGLVPSHIIELPRLIVVGEKNLIDIGDFLVSLNNPKIVTLIAGSNVKKIVKGKIDRSLGTKKIRCLWHLHSSKNDINTLQKLEEKIKKDHSHLIIGIGGGRAVDAAKMIAFNIKTPFVSVPTAGSHDGISSPFVSLKSNKPHSVVTTTPLGVFVDIDIIKKAPKRLLSSGCGDLVANLIAVRDWELGRDKVGEYYGRYSANLALLSASIIMENASRFAKQGVDARTVVEALISAGVAACIAGSSRPCSGAEHLFSHALDKLVPGIGLHGEKCGIGSIMMAKLQGQDWRKIVKTLKCVGAPTTAKQIGLKPEMIVKALTIAQGLRPERYTILKEVDMTEKRAVKLATDTNVI